MLRVRAQTSEFADGTGLLTEPDDAKHVVSDKVLQSLASRTCR